MPFIFFDAFGVLAFLSFLAPPRCFRVLQLRLLLRELLPEPIAEALTAVGGAPSAEPVTDVPELAEGILLLLLVFSNLTTFVLLLLRRLLLPFLLTGIILLRALVF